MEWRCLALGALLLLAVEAEGQEKLRLCVQEDVTDSACNALARLDSPVKCERVVDSTECAIKLDEGRADFGVFTADELMLAQNFYPTGLQVVAELRNKDKVYEPLDFQSVVVVPKNHTSYNELGLLDSGYCHPGFSKSQLWNDHVLKYFEKKVVNKVCRNGITTAENELINVRDFFKKACRPGNWVQDDILDKKLKKKYPELCALCPDKENCQYLIPQSHGHINALDCLTSGKGKVAYVALDYVKNYFTPNHSGKRVSDYQFLCENGTTMDLDSENPCTWYKQPWKVVLSREAVAKEVISKLEKTATIPFAAIPWEKNLNDILYKDDSPVVYINHLSPAYYLHKSKASVELPTSDCGQPIRWCTVSRDEWVKCNWTAAAARSLGIQPDISCELANSVFECFDWISYNEADIMTIDSNYGLLARKVYGLTALLYCETMEDRNSVVIAVTRDKAKNQISKWADVKDKNACFPEFGGIAWLSFINAARDHRVLPESCAYPKIVSKLAKKACAPGFFDLDHAQDHKRQNGATDGLNNLCDLCPVQPNGERCEANSLNKYYGDKGALDCLRSGDGDIAFLEARNLKPFISNHSINTTDYQVLCKNGSLANTSGFDIDPICALSITIDSEVVSRRDQSDPHLIDAALVLLKIEGWLGYRGDSERRAVHIYAQFNNTSDLLFKDSTVGLVPVHSEIRAVLAYKELFKHADKCSSSETTIAVIAIVLFNFLIARFI